MKHVTAAGSQHLDFSYDKLSLLWYCW